MSLLPPYAPTSAQDAVWRRLGDDLRRLLRTNEAWEEAPSWASDWKAGGCGVLAHALKHWMRAGGHASVWLVRRTDGTAEHAVVRYAPPGGRVAWIDADGVVFDEADVLAGVRREARGRLDAEPLHLVVATGRWPARDIGTDREASGRVAALLYTHLGPFWTYSDLLMREDR